MFLYFKDALFNYLKLLKSDTLVFYSGTGSYVIGNIFKASLEKYEPLHVLSRSA